ncbi:MAG: LuxR family transcriptional regulator [Gordonibacter sp.]|nr:LuxR family transcriptional regulator [Gordonibacter sp.]
MGSGHHRHLFANVRMIFNCDTPRNVTLITLGYACLTGWFSHLYGGIGPTPALNSTFDYLLHYGSIYASIGILAGIIMFLLAVIPKPINRLLDKRITSTLAPTLIALATFMLGFIPDGMEGGSLLYLVCCGVSSAGWALMLLDYNRLLSHYPLQSIAALTGSALLLNILLSLVVVPTSPLANILVTAACPLIAAVALIMIKPNRDDTAMPHVENVEHQKRLRRNLYTLAACVMLWQIANKLVQTVSAYPNGETIPLNMLSSMQPWTILFILVSMVPMAVFYLLQPKRFKFSQVYRMFFMLALVGVLGLEFASYKYSAPVLYSLNGAAFQAVNLVFWPIALYASHRLGDPLRILAIVSGLWTLGPAVGIAAGTALGVASIATPETIVMLTAFVVLVMVFSYAYLFQEVDADFLADSLPRRRRIFRERCVAVADRFELTPREREVMQLIATGKDMAAMQELLVISKSTVSTHREHLYQKMNIHSKQELIALIDNEP